MNIIRIFVASMYYKNQAVMKVGGKTFRGKRLCAILYTISITLHIAAFYDIFYQNINIL